MPDEHAARRELVEYLRGSLAANRLLLLTTWDGVAEPPPEPARPVPVADIDSQSFAFTETPTLTLLVPD